MKLIWHIIRKDIVRDCWALLLWALLFVGQVGIGFALLQTDGSDRDWPMHLQLASLILVFLQFVTGYVLVARLVQADALVGTDMFWLTRPISVVRLLGAKLLGALLLFALLPVLLLLPWWLSCHFSGHDLVWVALDTLGWQLLMIAPAFLLASLTDDLGRVLLWTLLLVIGLLSWMVLLTASFSNGTYGAGNPAGGWMFVTRLWLCAVVFVVSSLLIAAQHFLTRHFVRSIVMIALSLGVIALIGERWRWDLSETIASFGRLPSADVSGGTVEQLGLQVGSARVTSYPPTRDADLAEPSVQVVLRPSGLPEGMSLIGEKVNHHWQWPDGLALSRGGYFGWTDFPAQQVLRKNFTLPVPPHDPETDEWNRARHAELIARLAAHQGAAFHTEAPLPPGSLYLSTMVPKSIIARIRQQSPVYSVDVRGYLTRPEVVVDLPLVVGAQGADGSQTFRLLHLIPIDKQPGRVAVLVTTIPAMHSMASMSVLRIRGRGQDFFRSQYESVNHAYGFIGWVSDEKRGLGHAQVGGVLVSWLALNVHPEMVVRNGKWVERDPDWLAHTSLAFVTEREVARFTRTATTSKFELPVSAAERNQAPAGEETPKTKP